MIVKSEKMKVLYFLLAGIFFFKYQQILHNPKETEHKNNYQVLHAIMEEMEEKMKKKTIVGIELVIL